MTTTLTQGATVLNPALILGYTSTRRSGNVVHRIIGAAAPDVTVRVAGLRVGTLRFLVLTHTAALALEQLHAGAGVIAVTDTDAPGIAMSYVLDGQLKVELDQATRVRWIVSVDFQEVGP